MMGGRARKSSLKTTLQMKMPKIQQKCMSIERYLKTARRIGLSTQEYPTI